MYEQTYKAVPLEVEEDKPEDNGNEEEGEMNALEEMARKNLKFKYKKHK